MWCGYQFFFGADSKVSWRPFLPGVLWSFVSLERLPSLSKTQQFHFLNFCCCCCFFKGRSIIVFSKKKKKKLVADMHKLLINSLLLWEHNCLSGENKGSKHKNTFTFLVSCLFSSCIPSYSKYIVFFHLPPAGSDPCQKNYLLICFSVSMFIFLILSHLVSSEDDEVHFEIYLNLLQKNNNIPLHRIYSQDIRQASTQGT